MMRGLIALFLATLVSALNVQGPILNVYGRGHVYYRLIELRVFSSNEVTLKNLHEDPLFVLFPSNVGTPGRISLTSYYVTKGLRSIADHKNFLSLHQVLRTSGPLSSIVFQSRTTENSDFFENFIDHMIIPDDFRVSSLYQSFERIGQQAVPVMYIAPRPIFQKHRFTGVRRVGTLYVNNHSISLTNTTTTDTNGQNTTTASNNLVGAGAWWMQDPNLDVEFVSK